MVEQRWRMVTVVQLNVSRKLLIPQYAAWSLRRVLAIKAALALRISLD